MDPTISFKDLDVIREMWPGKLVVKGVQNVQDCRTLADLGVDGIVLSNHGGRQLDRTVPSVDLIPRVRDAVGPDVAIVVDSGVRHGSDIAVALALGADACAIGRAYLYGLMAGGEPGVDKVIDILTDQFVRTLHLMGISSVAELRASGRDLLVAP
jgi:L-lactate dehydrogenase (cytochrome)